jgi:predicted oxidoreductase (fatty acid repression mutant protein)
VDENLQLTLTEARKIDADCEVGEEVTDEVHFADFGRRAILNLRQTLASKILELQKDSLYAKYKDKIGHIIAAEVYQVWKKEILLLDDEHKKLWDIVKNTLKQRISPEAFAKTEAKIDGCFAAGHGTVLYFEDTTVVKKLQDAFPSYSENFPTWSQHTSAMHQLAVWTMLEDAGLGASLQHYNPLIDDEVRRTWNLPENWMLIAEMPFGTPTAEPGEKEFGELSERIKIFR